MSREALKMALEALEAIDDTSDICLDAMHELRKALAQPEQEPAAWRHPKFDIVSLWPWSLNLVPLYASPPQRHPLTNEELAGIYMTTTGLDFYRNFARAIEAAHGIGNKT